MIRKEFMAEEFRKIAPQAIVNHLDSAMREIEAAIEIATAEWGDTKGLDLGDPVKLTPAALLKKTKQGIIQGMRLSLSSATTARRFSAGAIEESWPYLKTTNGEPKFLERPPEVTKK